MAERSESRPKAQLRRQMNLSYRAMDCIVAALLANPPEMKAGSNGDFDQPSNRFKVVRSTKQGGRVAEWFKAPDSKSGVRATVS